MRIAQLAPLPASLLTFAMLTFAGCPAEEQKAPLPPAGLAGEPTASPGAAVATAASPSSMPAGSGVPAMPPPAAMPSSMPGAGAAGSGLAMPGAAGALPPGHPPIDGAAIPAPMPMGMPGGGAEGGTLSGTVLETMDVPQYTYMRVKTGTAEEWIAVMTTPVKVGDKVSVAQSVTMNDFHSSSLNRTFPRIVFGSMLGKQ